MALTNAPLLGTRHDAQLFVNRESELGELERNVELGWNTLVLGPAGIGKTSLLNRFAADLENRFEADAGVRRRVPLRVVGQPASAVDFFHALVGQMIDRLEGEGVVATVMRTAQGALEKLRSAGLSGVISRPDEGDTTAELLQTLRLVGSVLDDLRGVGLDAVILVDELASSEIAQTVFGRMRDELWTLRAAWFVAGRPSDSEILLMPPADTFFERRLALAPLTHADATALLHARLERDAVVDLSDEEIDQLARLGNGHPLALVAALRAVASGTPTRELIDRRRRVAALLESLSPPAQRLAREIVNRAQPARATDEALLRQMGWTSSRLRQVLHELANAGVVDVVDADTDGPGRPSKAYVPSIGRLGGFGEAPVVAAMPAAENDEATESANDTADGSR
jgi:hypothetical protein